MTITDQQARCLLDHAGQLVLDHAGQVDLVDAGNVVVLLNCGINIMDLLLSGGSASGGTSDEASRHSTQPSLMTKNAWPGLRRWRT